LSVALAEPYLKAWISLLVGLLLPSGFGVMVLIGFLEAIYHQGALAFSRMDPGAAVVCVHTVACIPLSLLALMFRRKFLSWPRSNQWWCAFIAGAAIAISISIVWSHAR
jgi:hypothetical protein